MTQLPEINWHQLRGEPPSGSQRDGFEELANQLMIYGNLVTWPAGTVFSTFGNPDGGREGRGELPNGDVWAWQAKYLFKLDDDELSQITGSVDRVLQTEPKLTRYFILMPYNHPAGDTATITSAWTKWNKHLAKWQTKARTAGINVEFEFIGKTRLNNCLLQPSQVGRLRYWFDLDSFSPERFQAIADRAAADAGGRYTPELNVGLPIAEVFDGLARTPAFQHRIRTALAAIREARGTYGLTRPEQRPDLFTPAITALEQDLDQLEALLTDAILQAGRIDGTLPDPSTAIQAAKTSLNTVSGLLSQHSRRDNYYSGNAASLHTQIRATRVAISNLNDLRTGRGWQTFDHTSIIVTGTGGAGKTHLLCDLAKTRAAEGKPTVILLGEHFEHGPLETDIGRIIGFSNPADQLLATLDAASQATNQLGLIIIDGLNEATDRSLWNKYLGSFLNTVAKHRHLRLVLSCRTEFLDDTMTETLLNRLPRFEHTGFDEVGRDAINQFLDWYGIQRPSFPLLDPEFTNPLFLKLLCTTLQTRNEHQFPRTGIGTSWVYNNFLGAINERLATPARCDYRPSNPLVHRAVEQIAAVMHTTGSRRLPMAEVETITTKLLDRNNWTNSLLNGLLKEAVLAELRSDNTSFIRFGYERLGDIALAHLIAAENPDTLSARVAPLAARWFTNAGVLQALASVLPETHGVELIDVLAIPTDDYYHAAHTDFLLSVSWRRPDAITTRPEQIITQLLANHRLGHDVYNALLQVATIPNHPLNAEWLHTQLSNLPMPQRDATWSHYCDHPDNTRSHLTSLIEWAWSEASHNATDETRHLAALTLTWALTSSHRATRDNATKAVIALLEPAPHLYQRLLQQFNTCDDDAIEERLLAIGCGIAQRTLDPAAAAVIASVIYDHTIGRNRWPENYLSRDYARRAIDTALTHGWQPESGDIAARVQPPYTSDWIEPGHSNAQIRELDGPPDYKYSAVGHALTSDFADFHKYFLKTLKYAFRLPAGIDPEYLGRVLFTQVLKLGWTPELFGAIDKGIRYRTTTDTNDPEGFAQKYIWTTHKQLIGRMTDRYPLNPTYRDHGRTAYQTPLDVRGHDIDPTLLLRRTENRVYSDTPTAWFAPTAATFPHGIDEHWPTHDEYSPPADALINCTDPDRKRWLVLEGHYQWSQPQHPEDAAAGHPHHVTWAQIRSYLINADSIDTWANWAKDQDWNGRWMPESGSPTGLLLADHPYHWGWPDLETHDYCERQDTSLPDTLLITTSRYGGIANDEDHSDSRHLYTFVPSTDLCTALHLQRLDDFRWGRDGTLLAESFAARNPGPDSVHLRLEPLTDYLINNGKALLWTILAEKHTTVAGHSWPRDGQPLMRNYSASYILDGKSIRLAGATARTLHEGGQVSEASPWTLPGEIPL